MNTPSAIVLFGHGSRDPLWRAPMDAVAARVQALAPHVTVVCAFLEWTSPPLPEAVAALVAQGHRHLRVMPMFLGMGHHVREDLPVLIAELREQHPDLQLELLPAVGEQAALLDCLAGLALGHML